MLDLLSHSSFSNAEVVGKIIHVGGVNEQLPLTTELLKTMPFNGEEAFSFPTLPQESLTISFSLSGFYLMISLILGEGTQGSPLFKNNSSTYIQSRNIVIFDTVSNCFIDGFSEVRSPLIDL